MTYPYVLPALRVRDAGNGMIQVNHGHGWSEPFRRDGKDTQTPKGSK